MNELEEAFGGPLTMPPPIDAWPPAEEMIPELLQTIVDFCDPLAVILFGSFARGDQRPDSDVDLLVVMPRLDDKRVCRDHIRRAVAHLPVSKDIIVTTPDEIQRYGDVVGTILYPALREGKILYDRRNQE